MPYDNIWHTATTFFVQIHTHTGAPAFSICKKVKASIKTKNKEVRPGQLVRIDIRLINRSGDDVDLGQWLLMLPDGVTYEKASIDTLEVEGNLVVLNPIMIEAKKKVYLSIALKIDYGTRLVFRSFLNDVDAYCEAASAITVRIYIYTLNICRRRCAPPSNTLTLHPFLLSYNSSWSRDLRRRSRPQSRGQRSKRVASPESSSGKTFTHIDAPILHDAFLRVIMEPLIPLGRKLTFVV